MRRFLAALSRILECACRSRNTVKLPVHYGAKEDDENYDPNCDIDDDS